MTLNPLLLLIRGAGLDRTTWNPVVARIPGGTPVLAIDLPGHGGAPGIAYDRNVVPRLAEHVAARLSALRLVRPHVVGHSLGGAVALEVARLAPVAAVTALCPTGFGTATHASVCAARMRAKMRLANAFGPAARESTLGRAILRRLVLSGLSARPRTLKTDVAAADVASMLGSDLLAPGRYAGRHVVRAGDLHPRVNLVWAELDQIVPRSDAVRATRCFPDAEHLTIPAAGHLVMRDDPDTTAAVIHACHTQLALGGRILAGSHGNSFHVRNSRKVRND